MATYQKKQNTIVGIDYSLNSPAICIADDNFDFNKCSFHFLTSKKKHIGKMLENVIGYEHKEWTDPIQRFKNISDFVIDIIFQTYNPKIFIEGYSFGSKGQGLFQIAENCGILKYRLLQKGYSYTTVVPSVVKKGATGKGNARKDAMHAAWFEETGINLQGAISPKKSVVDSPVSDVVDAYYICKCLWRNMQKRTWGP